MNWTILLLNFALAVFMGAGSASLFAQTRPGWSRRKQLFAAALVLPAVTLLLTLAGLAYVLLSGAGAGENMQDLAIATMAAVGTFFAAVAFAGGVVGAVMTQRKRRR